MPNFDFASVPKIVCEGTATGINRAFITMVFKSGPSVTAFSFSPEDAKNFAGAMAQTISLYEKQFGEIVDTNKPVPTPLDLSH